MSLFFMTFFAIYGGVHLYFFTKVRAAFAPGGQAELLLGFFLLLAAAAPAILRILERSGWKSLVPSLAWIAYLWMGFLFFFFVTALMLDGYRFLCFLGACSQLPVPSARTLFLLPSILAVATCVYSYFEALDIRTERLTITTAKLPAGISRLRIVQISDVHIGLIVRDKRLAGMLAKVREAEPDILVSTGDLLDGQPDEDPGSAELLRAIRPRFGKYAVTGNHEFYIGIGKADAFLRDVGFTLLRGEGMNINGLFNVAGVDDPAGQSLTQFVQGSEQELLRRLPPDRFTLLLKHRPVVEKGSYGLFDLQLSGHVHKGQLFPFNLVTHFSYPVKMGLSSFGNGSSLYVSRGTGTWGPPLRFLAPPEVTVIDLVRSIQAE